MMMSEIINSDPRLEVIGTAQQMDEIAKALRLSSGNKTKASALLGISRFTLQRKLDKYGIGGDGGSGVRTKEGAGEEA